MEIFKVKDYKRFADSLEDKTGCVVTIRLMGKNHTHYQLDKRGLSLGVLCVDNGELSFAPFVTLDSAQNDQYINAKYIPLLDDFIGLLGVLREMFVED